jgi:hypothetical protein
MFNDTVDFLTTGETYKSIASNSELVYTGDDGDYYVYASSISGAGYINLDTIIPIVTINSVPINNNVHQMPSMPCVIDVTTRTETKSGCHGISKESYTKIHTYFYYKVRLPHSSIEPTKPIYFYDATGALLKTLSANDPNMDYARGIWNVPGVEQNATIEQISTSSYWVMYAVRDLEIDYDNVLFKIKKAIIPSIDAVIVRATYEYWSVMTAVHEIASVIDGRWDTQVQTEFYAEPPTGYNYAILDLGSSYDIQAIDLVAGFFKPDEVRKYDIDMKLQLQYSTDGSNYYNISDTTSNFDLSGGDAVSFEEDDLGTSFSARYLKIVINDLQKIDFENGLWVAAFSELSAYDDIILDSNATLIATTQLAVDIDPDDYASGETYTITVDSTSGFDVSGTAYIDEDSFTYTGSTSTTFTGCSGLTSEHLIDERVHATIEGDTTMYDDDNLLSKLGDRLYKEIRIDDEILYSSDRLDAIAKAYLEEFYKNHSKISVDVLYSPHIEIGYTVHVTDAYNNIDANYFVESVKDNSGYFSLVLAKYPN